MSPSISYSYYSPCHLNSDGIETKQSAITLSVSVIIAILSPVAVAGNALIMATIWKNQTLRTPSYILLCFLAFTDLCTGLITQPFHIAAEMICLNNSQEVQKQLSFFLYARSIAEGSGTYFSSLTLTLLTFMSIERWLHMTQRSLLTMRRSFVIATVMMLLHVPVVAFRLSNLMKNIHRFVANAILILILLLCLITTSFAYFKVFQIIRRHQQQVQAYEPHQNFGQPGINLAKYKKSVFTILYILGVFYVSYLPFMIFIGLSFRYNHSDLETLFTITLMFLFLSSALNPLICLWRMNDIRNGVKQLISKLLCKEN